MEINEFIANLKQQHFTLAVENDKLLLKGDKKNLSKDELAAIKSNEFVISYIKENKSKLIAYIESNPEGSVIEKQAKNISAVYRLSGLQQGMLFHGLYEVGSATYMEQLSCNLVGVDLDIFKTTWNQIIKSHSILRTSFNYDSFKIPVQCVHDAVHFPIEITDIRQLDNLGQAAAVKQYEEADLSKGFDFKTAPLMRIGLLQLTNGDYRMVWTTHHILMDGWSLGILMGEFLNTYELLKSGKQLLVKDEDRFEDYIRYIDRIDKVAEKDFWSNYLTGVEQSTLLPFLATGVDRNKGLGNFITLPLLLNEAVSAEIQHFAQHNRLTVNTLFQGVWAYLLHQYTGNNNIVYGVIVSGRPDDLDRVEKRVGMYINTLPFHAAINPGKGIVEWLQDIQTEQVNARQYQYTPLQTAQVLTGLHGDWFDTLLSFENFPVDEIIGSKHWSLKVEDLHLTEHTNYPLSVFVENGKQINIRFNYNGTLLHESYVNEISLHFENVLQQIIAGDDQKIGDLSLLTKAAEQQLLSTFNDTATDYPVDKTIVDLFKERALAAPDSVAVIFETQHLSYRELDERSSQLAHYLIKKGIQKETLVPICIERGIDMVVGLLGILKAGGAYVPVDPEYPADRIAYMLEDTHASIVISSRESRSKITGDASVEIIEIDGDWSPVSLEPTTDVAIRPDTKQLAYVIYTSGSTGKPKGVMIEHTSVVNLLLSIANDVSFNACSVFMSVTTFSFDICYLELYMPLVSGGKLVVLSRESAMDGFKLADHIKQYQPTHVQGTPSTWQLLLDASLQNNEQIKMLVGGEALKADLKSALTQKGEVWNVYGPTETTIWSTIKKLATNENISIGKPIWNTTIQILNASGQLVPAGVAGEILIGGVGLARGYYNRPDLTAEKFVTIKGSSEGACSRMYRTGDLGRWLPDGNIECLGRIDEQVKIRGYRIELGEIETLLQQSGFVKQAVVLAKEDKNGNKRLVGYIVPDGKFDKQLLQNHLSEKLPEYMVPALWMQLEVLPLTPNGKINRKALPNPDASELLMNVYAAPRNAMETQLASIWQQLLQVERVGIDDNFFELGGHSLLVMRLVTIVRKEMGMELSIKQVFQHATIATLATQLGIQGNGILLPAIQASTRPEHIPLSFSQERIWFIDQLEGTVQYHLPTVLRLSGKLNLQALELAIKEVVERHESLRSVIYEEQGDAYQRILDAGNWKLEITTNAVDKNDQQALQQYIRTIINQPFDLSADFMLRAMLIPLEEEEHLLVVNIHHIASDGWSLPIIVKEVAALYSAGVEQRSSTLAVLPIQYPDFAIWQRNYLQGPVLDDKMNYWKEKLNGVAPLQLPTDFVRPHIQSTRGNSIHFVMDELFTNEVQQLSKQLGTTLFMTLLAAFKVLLHRYSGQEDICVGTPVAGRVQEETAGLVGFFVNTLALRTEVAGESTFIDLLAAIKNTTIEAYEQQEAPFEKIVEAVVKERDMSRSPLFQVMFVLQNTPDSPEIKLPGLALTGEVSVNETSKYDISFYITETAAGLHCSVEYCTDLYVEATMLRMIDHYKNLLHAIIQSPGKKIGLLPMLTDSEEQQLLKSFNNTEAIFPLEKSLIDLFEEQVLKTPESVAIIFGDTQIAYQQLNEQSNQLAQYLHTKGIKPGTLVPICLNRSIEMVIGILGILKAGAAYVPIDADYPEERIRFILSDTAAEFLITNKAFATAFSSPENVVLICADDVDLLKQPTTKLSISAISNQVACVTYTSGSSGRPKGVVLTHTGIVNRLFWMWNTYPFEQGERNAIKTSIGFIDHAWELFGALNQGIPSVIFGKDELLDLDILVKKLAGEKISRWVLVPSLLRALLIKLKSENIRLPHLKYWTSSGETLPVDLVADFYKIFPADNHTLLNIYGASEVSADVTFYDTSIDSFLNKVQNNYQHIPIGKPIANTAIYILDKYMQLLPRGITGEICVGGVQLAIEYFNQPPLTAERFIANPFDENGGARIFKTGDYGRWLADGNIEYLGRIDDQVKIRGNRVELGEIENALRQGGMVKQCVVLAKPDSSGNNMLVAYVVADAPIDRQLLIAVLKDLLPDYMVPYRWVQMETLPLTSSGKIHKRSLPDPDENDVRTNIYTAPTTDLELQLADIWQQLLKKELIGIHDNFFELGGHSLLAMRVVSAIRNALGLNLSIKDLFAYTTIAALANHLQKQDQALSFPVIEIQPRPDLVPLSFSQERLWFIDHLEGSLQYHMPLVLNLKGNFDKAALGKALGAIIARHEVLRTVFREIDGKVYQSIKPAVDWQLRETDGSKYAGDLPALKSYIRELVKAPFDLSTDFPVRALLINLSTEESVLVVTLHHIASDAWSMSVIVKEVVELYSAFTEDREAILPSLPLQYADFAVWQRNYLQGEILDKKLTYWKQKLDGLLPLQLPTNFLRPSVRGTKGASANFKINQSLSHKIQALSQQQGASLFMVLLSAFKILLHRYSGQEDISVGTSIASRQQKDLEGLIGFFVNTLALRDEVKSWATFTELLQQVKTTTLEAYEHQELPFEKVVETVVTERDMSRSPLFQVMLVLANTPESTKLKLGEVELSGMPVTNNISKFDITFFIAETPNGLSGTVEYSTDLYEAAMIEQMMDHFGVLLDSIVKAPEQKIGLLPMISDKESQQLLELFNNSKVAYPSNKSIVDLFEEQVVKTPGDIAVVFENESITYLQLNERANQLAHQLKSMGIPKDALVPLYMERSADMITGILGIMKAGAAYVPVDTDFPAERIRFMLEDCGNKIIVSNSSSAAGLKETMGAAIVKMDQLVHQSSQNLTTKPLANQLAYAIYTSGSTGRPKGVMIEHRSLVDYYYGLKKHTQIDQCRSFALVSTIATDLGNTVIYASLLSGGALHVFSKESVSNIEYLSAYFDENKIDCLKIVPSHWKALSPEDNLLLPKKLLIFGGEALQAELVEDIRLSGSHCSVVNHYGPTETTIGKLLHVVNPHNQYNKTIPIGKPFSNTNAYVLSKNLQLCPVGVPGQLYLSGDGLARGYYNNDPLTKEKFIPNPFSSEADAGMYGTGDLVKWLPDGNIEFIGRVDDQVKIRGYRIEPGEIEAVLQQCEHVSQAVVIARDDKQGSKRLLAYIVPEYYFEKEEILNFLKEKLPDYMIPAVLTEMAALPLTANGKVDRKSLPDPDTDDSLTGKYVAPRNDTETKLAAIWEEVLEEEPIGVHDDFFELGGHSLLAVRLISAIRKAFNVEMPIGDIFDYPTVALLAAQLSNQSGSVILPVIEKYLVRPVKIPLSFSQERLWFIHQLGGSLQYHVPTVLRLSGKINQEALAFALKNIVARHEVLRTVYMEDDGMPYQIVQDAAQWQLSVIDGESFAGSEAAIKDAVVQLIRVPFNLVEDYMLRAAIIQLNEVENILVVTVHHIASDGWSKSILVNDFATFYQSFEKGTAANLPLLPVQYADYAIWQRNYLQGAVLNNKIDYWKTQLKAVANLQLPTDYLRPAIQSTRGSIEDFEIENKLTAGLQTLSQQQGGTLFMTLLAAFKVLLYRYSDQQDICVGTPIAGRQQQEVEGLIGFFVNTLALRTELLKEDSFIDLLKKVRKVTLEAYEHQELPFEKVLEAVMKERDMSRSPVFQVMFIMRNTPEVPELALGDVQLKRGEHEHSTSQFDLTLIVTETINGLSCSMEYSTDLYARSSIQRMIRHYINLLNAIVAVPDKKLAALPMLSAAEETQLLVSFNDTAADFPTDKNVVQLFEQQVEKTPESIALIFENESITYSELNKRSNNLAHHLVDKGVKKGVLVPILTDRSIEMVIGILAILKTGAAYVPIESDHPADRIDFVLEDTNAHFLVTDSATASRLNSNKNIETVIVDSTTFNLAVSEFNLSVNTGKDAVFSIIYTSGSSGKPKGVILGNDGIVNRMHWMWNAYPFSANETCVIKTSISFVDHIWEIFGPLCAGIKSVVLKKEELINLDILISKLSDHKISRLVLVPSLLSVLLDKMESDQLSLKDLQYFICSGEAIQGDLIDDFYRIFPATQHKLLNIYGSSEVSADVTCYDTSIDFLNTVASENKNADANKLKPSGDQKDTKTSIGKPIANNRLYIVDQNGGLVANGVAGEIWVGGVQVAHGYLNLPALTSERFINNTFDPASGLKIFKTGDVGCWLPDGNVSYLGRKDDQVKIRGHRIELGEIENQLRQSQLVSDAVVLLKADAAGEQRLVGYVVPEGVDTAALQLYLKAKLPDYMIPYSWVVLDALPLTYNGKLDKKALPDPELTASDSMNYVAPENELEIKLAEIWQDILHIDIVGIHDNFFALGGHSLMVIKLVSVMKKRFELVVPIPAIFQFPTIHELANYIEWESDKEETGDGDTTTFELINL
jgi:amino acid adenylation domain-containing protein